MPKETVTTPSSPNRTASARSAYASRTFGRYAVGLRPILDPHASLAFTPTTSEKNKHGQQRNPAHLTGPAPSGMTLKGCHVRKPSRRRAGTPTGAVVAVSVSTCRRPSLLGSSTVRRPPAASHVMDSPAWTRPPDRAEQPPVEGNGVDRSDRRPSPRLGQLRMRTARGVDVQGCPSSEPRVRQARVAASRFAWPSARSWRSFTHDVVLCLLNALLLRHPTPTQSPSP